MPKSATPKTKYTKVNATPLACQVLNILAAERKLYVYEILDEVLRKEYPGYFKRIEYKTDISKNINAETTRKVKKKKPDEGKLVFPEVLCCKAEPKEDNK